MNSINWLSVILSAIVPLVIAVLFYHKLLLGRYLTIPVNPTNSNMKDRNWFLFGLVSLILSVLLSAFFLNFNNDGINQEGDYDTFLHGAWHGLFLSITVVVPIVTVTGLLHRCTLKQILISIIYWIFTMAVMGGIMDAMNHWENIPLPTG